MGKECECNCSICKSACMRKPGWMIPQDIINISEYLKMGMEEVFKKYLSIDYYARPLSKGGHIFVLSPCSTDNAPGEVWPRNPLGKCTFLKTIFVLSLLHLHLNAESICTMIVLRYRIKGIEKLLLCGTLKKIKK